MKNPRLILQILNLLNGLLLGISLVKIMGWSTFFNPIKLIHIILGAFVIYGLKSWIEVKTNTKDPIKTNKSVYTVFSIGSGIFLLGLAFNLARWPFAQIILIVGVITACSSFVLSFFAPENDSEADTDIIDDINYD